MGMLVLRFAFGSDVCPNDEVIGEVGEFVAH